MDNEELKKAFESLPFKIGDVVIEKTVADRGRREMTINPAVKPGYGMKYLVPQGNIIVGVLAEQCYGGVQVHYRLRRYGTDGGSCIESFYAFELEHYAKFAEECAAYVTGAEK